MTEAPRLIRVLLVDDDDDDHVMIRDLLSEVQSAKYAVEWVASYEEGRACIAADLKDPKHDIYLVDFRLGSHSGLELLRESVEQGCRKPFILMTGYGDHEVDLEAMRIGAADYLVKAQLSAPLLERSIRYSLYHSETIANLREREENFRNLFNSTFEGVLIHRGDQIIDANEAAGRVFGYSRREMVDGSLERFFHNGNGEPAFQTTGRRKDGSEIQLEVVGKPYHYKGEDVRLTAIRDVTARKMMEAQILQQDRLASVGLLASSLAHEIGTPLGVIRGRAEFMGLQVKDDEAVRKSVEVIVAQIDRVSKLIRSLLNLARGDKAVNLATVPVSQVVAEVIDLMSAEFRKYDLTVESRLTEAVKIRVQGQAEPLHQVVLNLLVNSAHAIGTAIKKQGRQNGHFVRIYPEDQGSQWAICVQDSGCGISSANLKNLFKPFFTTKDIGEGTGLGLVTSYRIVESWGGSITVSSQEGVGTTFRILLPKA